MDESVLIVVIVVVLTVAAHVFVIGLLVRSVRNGKKPSPTAATPEPKVQTPDSSSAAKP
jgi:hypothetical protein